jgi:Signal transduction histidine kinase
VPNAQYRLSELLITILAVCLAVGVSYAIHVAYFPFEEELTYRLASFTGASIKLRNDAPTLSSVPELLTIALSIMLSIVSLLAWSRLEGTARKIVTLQLVALVLIVQTIGLVIDFPMNNILALFVAATSGIIFGLGVKSIRASKVTAEAGAHQLEALRRELLESKLQMIKEDEVERRVLAGDLHDQVLNDLKVVKSKITDAESLDQNTKTEIDKLIVDSMHQIREVMDSLSPAVLEHLGFTAAIEDCIRVGCERADLKARFKSDIEDGLLKFLSPTEQTLIYRLVQESVTNIRKHAQAKTVRGRICIVSGDLLVEIADDGVGFDAGDKPADSRGLRYMRQRASIIGAKVDWTSGENGKGTRVTIKMPLPEEATPMEEKEKSD